MPHTIIFLAKARLELLEAWIWYEDKQVGLGDRLNKEVEIALQQIQLNPQLPPLRRLQYRERRLEVFPYLIIYTILDQESSIVIVSVFHTKRNPQRKYK